MTEKANKDVENWRSTVDDRITIRQQWRKEEKERLTKTNKIKGLTKKRKEWQRKPTKT